MHEAGEDSGGDPFLADYERARDLLRTPDWRKGLDDLERLAYGGSVMSMLLVSDAMRTGWMYDQDLPGAENWYRVAHASGSLRGLFGLGLTHLAMGRHAEALDELERAAAGDYAPAFNALAGMHFRGDGVEVDRKRAAQLWREGAVRGHLPAKVNLVKQQIRGAYGLRGRAEGWLRLLPTAIEYVSVKSRAPYSDRFR